MDHPNQYVLFPINSCTKLKVDTAVEDTAVEGTAVEGTAVEGTAVEGTAVVLVFM
jgi:hypothetical protein